MNKVVFSFIFFLLFSAATFSATVDDFRLPDLKNKSVNFADIKGEKLSVLDFWATWCKPCRAAIPKLVKLYEKYRDQGVQFIGINTDGVRNLPKVKPTASSFGISYPVLLDTNGEVQSELNVTALPTLLIVDQDNKVVYFHKGYLPGDEEKIEAEIINLLKFNLEKKDE